MKIALVAVLASSVAFAAPTTSEDAERANESAFLSALAKQKLATLDLRQDLREEVSSIAEPAQTPGHIDLLVTAGWNAQVPQFVANDKHELFIVHRQPKVANKLTLQLGCPSTHFAGGRGWFEHVRFAVPTGYAYKGVATIAYATTQVTRVEATKQPDGTPCPEVPWMMD